MNSHMWLLCQRESFRAQFTAATPKKRQPGIEIIVANNFARRVPQFSWKKSLQALEEISASGTHPPSTSARRRHVLHCRSPSRGTFRRRTRGGGRQAPHSRGGASLLSRSLAATCSWAAPRLLGGNVCFLHWTVTSAARRRRCPPARRRPQRARCHCRPHRSAR